MSGLCSCKDAMPAAEVRRQAQGITRFYVKVAHGTVKLFQHLRSGHQTQKTSLSAEIQFLYCLNRHVDNPNNLQRHLFNNLEWSFQRYSQTTTPLTTEHVPKSTISLHRPSQTFGKKMDITYLDSSAKKIGKRCKGYRMSSDSAP